MGLVIFIIYIPILLIISTVSILISLRYLRDDSVASASKTKKIIAYISGILFSTLLTSTLALWYTNRTHPGLEVVFGVIAISLLLPPLIGLLAIILRTFLFRNIFPASCFVIAGILQSVTLTPALLFLTANNENAIYSSTHRAEFDRICSNAKTTTHEIVAPATSFAIVKDYKNPVNISPQYFLHVKNTSIQFIEYSDDASGTNLRRISMNKNEINPECDALISKCEFTETKIDHIEAEYLVKVFSIEVPSTTLKHTSGNKIEISKTSDGKIISSAEHYANYRWGWACPSVAGVKGRRTAIMSFVAKSLHLPEIKGN